MSSLLSCHHCNKVIAASLRSAQRPRGALSSSVGKRMTYEKVTYMAGAQPIDKTSYDSRWINMWDAGLKPGEAFDAKDVSPMLKHLLETGAVNVKGKRCIVPGCGRGYDVVALVAAGAKAAVGLELSTKAVEEAQAYLEQAKLGLNLPEEAARRATFIAGDFFNYEPEEGPFDWGYDYTFFCAMHPTMRGTQSSSWGRVIKPGGELVTLIFPVSSEMDPNTGPPWPVTPDMYQECFGKAGFALEQIGPVPPELSHKGREGKEILGQWRRQ